MSKQRSDITEQANAMLIQKNMTHNSQLKFDEMNSLIDELENDQKEIQELLVLSESLLDNLSAEDIERLAPVVDEMYSCQNEEEVVVVDGNEYIIEGEFETSSKYNVYVDDDEIYLLEEDENINPVQIETLSTLDLDGTESWDEVYLAYENYAKENKINISDDPFKKLMTDTQLIEFEKMVERDFTYQKAHCDKYDYMISATCGGIAAIIDICFVSFKLGTSQGGKVIVEDTGALTQVADKAVDEVVIKFAKLNGWDGSRDGSYKVESAIGYLEKKFRVNYDHRHTADVDGFFDMNTKNHHIMSLGHSPDLVGLIFSILGQFTGKAHFITSGKLVTIDSEFQLQGSTFVAKIFCGFSNWLGHLFSDMAGSSGTRGKITGGRGSGIPIPFYSLFQFFEFGKFNITDKDKSSFATTCKMAFQEGYDMRHGLAIAVPVVIAELLTRLMYMVKQKFYHLKSWTESLPSINKPELSRMLLVSHGTLSLIDAGHAGLKSGGNLVAFILQSNIIAYARFATLALKEIKTWYYVGKVSPEKIEDYLDKEYERLLAS